MTARDHVSADATTAGSTGMSEDTKKQGNTRSGVRQAKERSQMSPVGGVIMLISQHVYVHRTAAAYWDSVTLLLL